MTVEGTLGRKILKAIKKLIKDIAMNNCQRNSRIKSVGDLIGIWEISEFTVLATQVEALRRKIDNLST